MNTATRVLTALAATTVGAGFTVMAAGGPATANTLPSYSACQALGGIYETDGGGWYCTHRVGAEMRDPSLLAVCSTPSWAYIIDDGFPEGTVAFYCSPPLVD